MDKVIGVLIALAIIFAVVNGISCFSYWNKSITETPMRCMPAR